MRIACVPGVTLGSATGVVPINFPSRNTRAPVGFDSTLSRPGCVLALADGAARSAGRVGRGLRTGGADGGAFVAGAGAGGVAVGGAGVGGTATSVVSRPAVAVGTAGVVAAAAAAGAAVDRSRVPTP